MNHKAELLGRFPIIVKNSLATHEGSVGGRGEIGGGNLEGQTKININKKKEIRKGEI